MVETLSLFSSYKAPLSVSTRLFPARLYRVPLSPHLTLTIQLSPCIYRLFSCATTTQAPPLDSQFAVDYLIQSWGLPSNEAIRASKKIQHLKSFDIPDAVLRFLRQTGISESDIRTAVLLDPRLLCSSVEKNLRPNIEKLQEVGLSVEDISGIISHSSRLFLFNIVPKVDFWMPALGSVESLYYVLSKRPAILCSDLEKVAMPNISFLREQCGLSARQILQLIMMAPRLVSSRPDAVVNALSQSTVDAKLLYLKSFGLSEEEVTLMIRRAPLLLTKSEEFIGRRMEFLIKEAGFEKLDVVRNPSLLMYNLQRRLIPRSIVRKLLMSKGIPQANKAFASFVQPSEKQFVVKFVLPYEHAIPGLHRAYANARAGKVGAI